MHHSDVNIHRTGFTSADIRKPLPAAAKRSPWPLVLAFALDLVALVMLAKALI